MNLRDRSRNVTRKSILLLAAIAISAFAWGQHTTVSKVPAAHASKPTPAASTAKAPIHPPAPSRVSLPATPHPASHPGGSASTPAGRSANARVNRAPDPVVDHIGDISEYRRGPAQPTPTSAPISLRGSVSAGPRPTSQVRTFDRTPNRTINRDGMQIERGLHGGRMIVSERNGTRIVTTGAGRGYVQHAYLTRGGHSYYSRTYLDRGFTRVGIYRGYNYGGREYYGYYPSYWYHPAFYNWAYRPWGAPVPWRVGIGGWGWVGAPWYGYYGGYFAPYPVYSSAAFWLTDYLIAADLQAAYAAGADANADDVTGYEQAQAGDVNSGSAMLTPDVKEAIAEEVKAQLAAEQQQSSGGQSTESSDAQARNGQAPDGQAQAPAPASSDLPSALDPARRTFVVPSNITVTSDGQECELTPGDIITRLTNTPDADQNIAAVVSASKKRDCALDKRVVVSLDTLQEMRNHFDEQLDNGIKMLAEKQGIGGLPKAPDTAQVASDVPSPPADTTVAKALNDQEAGADRAEMQMNQETAEEPDAGQFSAPAQQGTSLGAIARQARAQKQAQAQSDSESKPVTVPADSAPQN